MVPHGTPDRSGSEGLAARIPQRVRLVQLSRSNLGPMQRLFSMFPAGSAGAALLILRLSVAGTVLLAIRPLEGLVPPAAAIALTATIALALCPGVCTPLSCAAALLIHVGLLVRSCGLGSAVIIIHASMALSLLMLGPGAYSADARLFGRRLVLSNRD